MPTIQLPEGREARIFVTHRMDEDQAKAFKKKTNVKVETIKLPNKIAKLKKKIEKRGHTVIRQTIITLEIGDERFRAASFCSSLDNFNKLEGRRNAINKVLSKTHEVLSKEDREIIFFKICPEFKNKEEVAQEVAAANN